MKVELIAVILAVMSYTFSELEVDNDILIIILVFVLLFDLIGLEEALNE
ncbi:hypothetical protein [Psychrobacillus sp. MER TA 171]|nr:hypothetical protein [Psychrobacillus sp. MER TA 171]MCM3359138.1 hypothetical protein [Psychrobacillus sp. MER TA 171]